ncbi:double-CXXCG motif protein [Longimicrobium sp.]|uniref:double-CXXCG motif protein n=1 Tax=Longimicrobium sp. TaxID=2029185 RepID=UPI0039C9677F
MPRYFSRLRNWCCFVRWRRRCGGSHRSPGRDALRARLRPLAPPEADFGLFQGTARGRFGNFAWAANWTMLMKRETDARLREHGVSRPPRACRSSARVGRERTLCPTWWSRRQPVPGRAQGP